MTNDGNSGKDKLRNQKEIRAAIASLSIAAILLLIVLHCSNIQATSLKVYNISFNGASTIKDEGYTAIVENNPNNTGFVSIYGVNLTERLLVLPTYLTNGQYNMIKLKNDDFKMISNGDPIVLKISPTSIASGSYDGWILVKKGKSLLNSIPITAKTTPMTVIATLWVLIGIFGSLTIWEIIKYVKRKEAESHKEKLEAEALTNIKNLKPLNDNADYLEANNVYAVAFEKLRESAYWAQIATSLEGRWLRWRSFVKIILLEFGSIAFGIAVGFLGIYSNTAVTNLLVVSIQDILVLVGLGLGIGSLKEFVDKSA